MSITKEARGLLKRLVWQGFPETGHPESEQIILDHEEHLEAEAIISAALAVVEEAERIHVDFLMDNGAVMTLADWRNLQDALAHFEEVAAPPEEQP